MYIPKEVEEGAEAGEKKGISNAEEKTRREREVRAARKKVARTIEGWATMFRGDGGKDYFKVGEVKREPGWLQEIPKRELCDRAERVRPKRKD